MLQMWKDGTLEFQYVQDPISFQISYKVPQITDCPGSASSSYTKRSYSESNTSTKRGRGRGRGRGGKKKSAFAAADDW